MDETKIIIAYVVICLYYTFCRIHYLLVVKADEEYNELMEEAGRLVDKKKVIRLLILSNILFFPILAPLGMIKNSILFIKKKIEGKKKSN